MGGIKEPPKTPTRKTTCICFTASFATFKLEAEHQGGGRSTATPMERGCVGLGRRENKQWAQERLWTRAASSCILALPLTNSVILGKLPNISGVSVSLSINWENNNCLLQSCGQKEVMPMKGTAPVLEPSKCSETVETSTMTSIIITIVWCQVEGSSFTRQPSLSQRFVFFIWFVKVFCCP